MRPGSCLSACPSVIPPMTKPIPTTATNTSTNKQVRGGDERVRQGAQGLRAAPARLWAGAEAHRRVLRRIHGRCVRAAFFCVLFSSFFWLSRVGCAARPLFFFLSLFSFVDVGTHTNASHVPRPTYEQKPGRAYLYHVANQLDLASYGNGLDADGVKLYCAKVTTRRSFILFSCGHSWFDLVYVIERPPLSLSPNPTNPNPTT